MAEKYFPFNSVSGDREYLAADFAAYFADIIASGVSANGDNLPVSATSGLMLSVGAGLAWIKGHLYENTGTVALSIAVGESNPRIDRVCARLDVAARKIGIVIIKGTAAASPTAPAIVRSADYWDICLAEVAVAASAISITQMNITDTRTDNDICGVVRCLVETLDVGAFMANCQASFLTWFSNLQYVLDADVAGHLQNEINAIRTDLDNGVYSTTAILNVTTVPGAAVTLTLGTLTLSATANASGKAILYPNKLGTWSISVVTASSTYTGSVEVSAIGILNRAFPDFTSMAWADINAVGAAGAAPSVFNRGDKKNIALTTGETITIRLEDFSHDDLVSGGKAAMSFMMENLLATTYNMNSSDTNSGGWNSSAMRSRMSTFLSQMPADLRAAIKPVKKKSTAGSQSTSIQTTNDSLWLAASVEVGLETTGVGYKDEGTTYPLFVDNASRIKKLSNGAGSTNYWWLRSPGTGYATTFRIVNSDGSSSNDNASNSGGVCLGLCV